MSSEPVTGHWPSADAHAVVSTPVATDGAGGTEVAGSVTPAVRRLCGYCGEPAADETYSLALEWPPESDADPGRGALTLCPECARSLATDVLVDRALARGIDIFDGLTPAVESTK